LTAEELVALLAAVLVCDKLLTGTGIGRGIISVPSFDSGFFDPASEAGAGSFESDPRSGVPRATEPPRPPGGELDGGVLAALSTELLFIVDDFCAVILGVQIERVMEHDS
jgi:hypothetical protein